MSPTFLLLLPLLAAAKPSTYPYDSASCVLGQRAFEAKLESFFAPDDPSNESLGAQLLVVGSREAERRTGKFLSDGAFNFLKPGEGSICDKTAAYAVGGKLAAVLYTADNRPFQRILHVAFFDPEKGRVAKVEKNLGALKDVIATEDGFAFSNLVERSDAHTITYQSPWGKKLTGRDEDLGAFRRVSLVNGKIEINFDPGLSFEKSQWKDFYANQAAFLADAGWDSSSRKFRNVVVYSLSSDPKEGEQRCINMTARRGGLMAEHKWRCLKSKR